LAVLLVNIILRVKPVEHEIVRVESPASSSASQTASSFLCTNAGVCVEPKKMSKIMATTFSEHSFDIHLHDLRHALEAFSHKLSQAGGTGWNPVYALLANHAPGTSSHYGRDQNSFVGIPSNISEANRVACNYWNAIILHSPSSTDEETKSQLMRQLQDLKLLNEEDMIKDMVTVHTATINEAVRFTTPSNVHSLNKMQETTGEMFLCSTHRKSQQLDMSQCNQSQSQQQASVDTNGSETMQMQEIIIQEVSINSSIYNYDCYI
jgi:hypothetical protein